MCIEKHEIVRVEQLIVHRGSFLLDRISFSVGPGEVVAILGRTGAGKTLMLETMAGFCRPDGGAVFYRGIPVH